MTVRELIELLQKEDPEKNVYIIEERLPCVEVTGIEDIMVNEDGFFYNPYKYPVFKEEYKKKRIKYVPNSIRITLDD